MSFEEQNNVNNDNADAATLQPAFKKSQTYMNNNPALLHAFSQNYGKMEMKKATSVQIVRPQLSTLEATQCSADGVSLN